MSISRIQRRIIGGLSIWNPRLGYLFDASAKLSSKIHWTASEPTKDCLYVLLPGIADEHHDFEFSGFVSTAMETGLQGDLIAVDAHVGYYIRETIFQRLREEVIIPAKEQGYKEIWLAGTSLGALGSALYSIEHGSDIDGVFLMAPFLGERTLVREIRKAGGLKEWSSNISSAKVEPYQLRLWEGLKEHLHGTSTSLPIYLGYGRRDRFADSNQLLGESLPGDRVFVIPGGHDWSTWARLWKLFLESKNKGIKEGKYERSRVKP